MNNIDKQYQDLLQSILDYGVEKKDRTGTGTKSIFGYTIRHNMKDGFPLLTTKKMAWKTMVTELLWFLRGDTNIKFLVDNNCHIWDGDAYKNYCNAYPDVEKTFQYEGSNIEVRKMTQEEFIEQIKTDNEFAKKWGQLGPIYGEQWRSWRVGKGIETSIPHPYGGNVYESFSMYIDQIANLISELKTNPDSRRLIVSAWNVGELDQMVLPPCHYGFQVYTRELSEDERNEIRDMQYFKNNLHQALKGSDTKIDWENIPTRAISLMWNQRSVDTFLGLPFNIASYGLLLEIIAKAVNMVPDELIGNLGDTHLYSNHIEQAKEQIGRDYTLEERLNMVSEEIQKEFSSGIVNLPNFPNTPVWSDGGKMSCLDDFGVPRRTREPYPLPTLKINSGNENWHLLTIDEIINSLDSDITFKTENYQSHPSIKAFLSN
jgi:thymidylate synthase